MYHLFFTHSAIDGHLGCFHILVTVNNVVINIGIHISFRIRDFFSSYIFLEVELLYQMVFYFQFFEEPPHCFPQRLHQLTFPSAVQDHFSTSLPTFAISCLLDSGHSSWCEVWGGVLGIKEHNKSQSQYKLVTGMVVQHGESRKLKGAVSLVLIGWAVARKGEILSSCQSMLSFFLLGCEVCFLQ